MYLQITPTGQTGLVADISPYELPRTAFSRVENVRFNNGYAEKFAGSSQVFTVPDGEVPLALFSAQVEDRLHWIYATHDSLYRIQSGLAEDVSAYAYDATGYVRWNKAYLNGILVVNNANDVPQYWVVGDTGANFADLPHWDASWRCRIIRSYKNFLVALNITKSASEFPSMVKWSAAADPGALPVTWDEADPSFDAGEFSLGAGDDELLDGLPLGDAFVLYKRRGVWGMQFTGGTFIFRFWQIYNDRGILSPYCVAEFEGRHFVVGQDSFYVHDTQQMQDIGDQRVTQYFFNDLNQNAVWATFVLNNQARREIWVVYASGNETRCNKVLVWNYRSNAWSVRSLPNRVIGGDAGRLDMYMIDQWNRLGNWNEQVSWWESAGTGWGGGTEDTWESDDVVWDSQPYDLYGQRLVLAEVAGPARAFDLGESESTATMTAVLERKSLELPSRQTDRPQDMTSVKFVYTVWPKITGTSGGTVNVYVGGQMQIDDEPNWQGPIPFVIGRSTKVDCRVSGRLLSFRFESNTDISWRVQSIQIGYKEIAKW